MPEGKKRLLVDMDGTLSKFHDEVGYLERMFEKDFFKNLQPFENMIEAIKLFKDKYSDVEVFIVSAVVKSEFTDCIAEKNEWLDKFLPEIDMEHRIFTDLGRSKAEYLPGGATKNDFLLDDYNKGLRLFLEDGGSTIKCRNNINHKGLGAYGGEPGNLWLGPMVNTVDKPEMIVARLSEAMSLEYELKPVLDAYEIIGSDKNHVLTMDNNLIYKFDNGIFTGAKPSGEKESFSNILNCISWLSGNDKAIELCLETYPKTNKDRLSGITGSFYITQEKLENVLTNIGSNKTVNEFLNHYSWDDVVEIKKLLSDFEPQKQENINEFSFFGKLDQIKESKNLNKYIKDSDYMIRSAVARQGYGLDVLINDPTPEVRKAVAGTGYGLKTLINDSNWEVRYEVARQGYGLDVLKNDSHEEVRKMALIALEAEKESLENQIKSAEGKKSVLPKNNNSVNTKKQER